MKSISIIGAGKLAGHLGPALKKSGIRINKIISRSEPNASELAQKLETTYSLKLSDLPKDSDAVFILVPDHQIPQITDEIEDSGALFLHCSGALPLDTLSKFSNHGVFYPLYTFSKDREVRFQDIPIFIEAKHGRALDEIHEMAQRISRNVVELKGEQRQYLHLSAVFSNNFVNFFFLIADKILREQGLDFNYLLPIINETTEKIKVLKPREAQTGPALRNDLSTLMSHLELLSDYPDFQKIYSFVSDSISNEFQNKKIHGSRLWDILKPD